MQIVRIESLPPHDRGSTKLTQSRFMTQLATTAIGWIMSADAIAVWTFQHPAIVFLPLLGVSKSESISFSRSRFEFAESSSFSIVVSAITINFKYRSSPLNVILLGIFTLSEAVAIGCIIPLYDPQVVLKALVITTFTFLGLTLFTFQVCYPSLISYLLQWLIQSLTILFLS